jgi:dTDP-D-glucose 4,6-dehydratase
MAKRVLVTGVGGFIGSLALEYWYEKTDWTFLGLDSFKHKGYVTRIEDIKKRLGNPPDWNKRVKLFTHD